MRFDSKLHRQLLKHLATKAIDDERNRLFRRNTPRGAVEKLVFRNLRRRSFVFDARATVAALASLRTLADVAELRGRTPEEIVGKRLAEKMMARQSAPTGQPEPVSA